MSEPTPEVFVAVFGDESRAATVHAELSARAAGGVIVLLEAVVVSRDAAGRVRWDVAGRGAGHICSRADTIGVVEDRWVPEVARGLRGYHRLTSGGS